MALKQKTCTHLETLEGVNLEGKSVCEACIKSGDSWVHLRICQTCGLTLCCDSSPNQHATKHYQSSAHPLIASGEPGERWLYCYVDKIFQRF